MSKQPTKEAKLIGGGPSKDGRSVFLQATLETGESVVMRVALDDVQHVVADASMWALKAAEASGWRRRSPDGQEDQGIRIQPSHIALLEGATSGLVCLAVDVGPVRFRFDVPRSDLGDLGGKLLAASADETRKN